MSELAPSVYHYTDLAECLCGLKNFRARKNRAEAAFTALAEKLGAGSRTEVKKIFKGGVPVPKATLVRIAEVFELGPDESDYLELLRRFQLSQEPNTAMALFKKIQEMRSRHLHITHSHVLSETQLEVLESWYTLPLLFYLDLKDHSHDPDVISRHFGGKISPDQVTTSFRKLERVNLIRRYEDGRWVKTEHSVAILDHLPRPMVKRFHQMMIERSLESVQGLPPERRHLMGLSIAVKKDQLELLKKRISDFMVCLDQEFSSSEADQLYQLNLQLFNLARVTQD